MDEITQETLDKLNVEQSRQQNREALDALGGIETLMEKLGASPTQGLTTSQVIASREKFGRNSFPESPMKGFFTLFFEAFGDQTLLILIAAAIVSLVIGIIEDPGHGYVEGAAILIAVVLVAGVTAGNDYTKELQFRALEQSSQNDERTSVIRNGIVERINPADIVVGDLLLLQVINVLRCFCVVIVLLGRRHDSCRCYCVR